MRACDGTEGRNAGADDVAAVRRRKRRRVVVVRMVAFRRVQGRLRMVASLERRKRRIGGSREVV